MSNLVYLLFGSNNNEVVLQECLKNKFNIIDNGNLHENANDVNFNSSKWIGTICFSIATNILPTVILNSEKLITKKGDLSLIPSLKAKIPNIVINDYKFILISDKPVAELKKGSNEDKMIAWINKTDSSIPKSIITSQEFLSSLSNDIKNNTVNDSNLKVTCGLLAEYTINNNISRLLFGFTVCSINR